MSTAVATPSVLEDKTLRELDDRLASSSGGQGMSTSELAVMNQVRRSLLDVLLSKDDPALRGIEEASSEEGLPLTYDVDIINSYWDRRPSKVRTRLLEVLNESLPFLTALFLDWRTGKIFLPEVQAARAKEFRELLTRLGPTFVKFGQALSIRPDVVNQVIMDQLQLLCDAVPPFPTAVALDTIQEELGQPASRIFEGLTLQSETVAAASLGQVYKCRLRSSKQDVAVKVQRPDMLRTISLDLYVLRKFAYIAQDFQEKFTAQRTDYAALLNAWAGGTYKELDYNNEAMNQRTIRGLLANVTDVVVPEVYDKYTSRKVLTTEWIVGEKLETSDAETVKSLTKMGLEAYLVMLLEHGKMHADPHPGNLMKTPDGRLAILDFGLVAEIDRRERDLLVATLIHLANKNYPAVVEDSVQLDFLPQDVDRSFIVPITARILNEALQGGGAKKVNFQSLARDLAGVSFQIPVRIPPYFALIIRALGVLEGLALAGDPDFQLVAESYPWVSRRVLTAGDDSPILKDALSEILYKDGEFSARRFNSLMNSAQGYVAHHTDAFVDFDAIPEEQAPVDGALTFFFGPQGEGLRRLMKDEIAKIADLSGNLVAGRAAQAVLSQVDLLPPFLRPPRLFRAPLESLAYVSQLDEGEQDYINSILAVASLAANPGAAAGAASADTSGIAEGSLSPSLLGLGGGVSPDELRRLGPSALPLLAKPEVRDFAVSVADAVARRMASRVLRRVAQAI
ncbi:unnamed protein product [Vitrella brassicaformis CCMP3155]|uniref:ABC1 atypical kinase-like domain-containing protein n=2 Tax=Vitrella brassicaformis TaxID=1169539 RepID=A0A0G4H656_VITBC|nr:unnamed protein product [Vitrella brassicaformis CCMP3155]|eukprot:CEM39186.1 unnamed protein product [Vitrella brassicaformis CCMP3155]